MSTPDRPLNEADVDRIVQRRLAEAFARLCHGADRASGLTDDSLDGSALQMISQTAEAVMDELLSGDDGCPHVYRRVGAYLDPASYRRCVLCSRDEQGRTPDEREAAARAAGQEAERLERRRALLRDNTFQEDQNG